MFTTTPTRVAYAAVGRAEIPVADKPPLGILGLVNASLEDRAQLRREIDFDEAVQRQMLFNPAFIILSNPHTQH
jgi:hypothetical protein